MRNDLFLKQIGKRVQDIRQSKGIFVRRLGEMCNIDYANVSRFENGKQDILLLTLKIIAEQLEVDIKYFL
jgi:transcriptional regulator with XRE-family HTH domain